MYFQLVVADFGDIIGWINDTSLDKTALNEWSTTGANVTSSGSVFTCEYGSFEKSYVGYLKNSLESPDYSVERMFDLRDIKLRMELNLESPTILRRVDIADLISSVLIVVSTSIS